MIFHPSRVESDLLSQDIEQAFVAVTWLPAGHREGLWWLALLPAPCLGTHQVEGCQRGVAMHISGCCCTGLTGQEPGALWAGTAEKRDLETRGVECHPLATMQRWIRRAPDNAPRLGRVFPVEEPHEAQATLKRLGPHHSGLQMEMGCLFPGAESLETAQGLAGDLPVVLPPGPAALRGQSGGEPG
jgi:hypothetical protein